MFKDLEKETILASMSKEEILELKKHYESLQPQPEFNEDQQVTSSVHSKPDEEDFTAAFENVQW
jgi:hypothetical protein